MANIELTVLLATRNGGTVLPRVLAAYRAVARAASSWQLVVVDNGSEDDTALVLRSFQRELPLEILELAEPGPTTISSEERSSRYSTSSRRVGW